MRKITIICLLVTLFFEVSGQSDGTRPKLVVGITVDQMRQEYILRFQDRFGQGGFKRLLGEGFELKNGHYNYVPTYTGPGHASIYTGTTPAIHGIIGNDWFDKGLGKDVNCVSDPAQKPVGTPTGNGDVSPWRMLTTTITDELKLSSQKRSKVFGISIKDRGAVLPAGHMADGAFWFDDQTGKFMSSSYYMDKLPAWVDAFHKTNLVDTYFGKQWTTLYPIETYAESGPDNTPYEVHMHGKDTPTFPYTLSHGANKSYGALTSTPFSNDYLTEFAKALLRGEKMGQHTDTDFMTISYSATDYVGHAMGPYSVEIEDVYLRLDKDIADLLNTLDQLVGKGQYVVFLTADHAVAPVAQQLRDSKVPAGYFNESKVTADLKDLLGKYFPGRDLIKTISNDQIFFNDDLFNSNPRNGGVDFLIASELIAKYLLSVEGVANVYTESVIRQGNYDEGGLKGMIMRGYNPKRSGDVVFVLEPGWYSAGKVAGTTHGSPYSYDTNVPMLFYGKGVPHGSSSVYHTITDIAPTLAVLLRVGYPSGCTGQPIVEIVDHK